MQLHELACRSMSLHAVPWACIVQWAYMKFHECACSFMSLYAVTFFVWAAHKNFAVLVFAKFPWWVVRDCKLLCGLLNINLQQLSLANIVRRRETCCFTRLNKFCFQNSAKFPKLSIREPLSNSWLGLNAHNFHNYIFRPMVLQCQAPLSTLI